MEGEGPSAPSLRPDPSAAAVTTTTNLLASVKEQVRGPDSAHT